MLTVRTAAFSKLKSVIEVMVSLDDRSKTCHPLPAGVAGCVGCGRSARFTDEPCGPPTRPAKKGHVLCSSCMGMKKAASNWCGCCTLSGLPHPCAIVGALPLYAIRGICRKKDGSAQKSTHQNHSGCANDGPPRLMTLVGPQGALRAIFWMQDADAAQARCPVSATWDKDKRPKQLI